MLTFFQGINVKAYPKNTICCLLLVIIYSSMTVMTSFIHSSLCDLPFSLLLCCIAISQYIAIHWVQYIDMEKYNIVAVLQDSCHWWRTVIGLLLPDIEWFGL